MDHQHLTKPAVAVVAVLAVLVIAGAPLGSLAILLVFLACPLMMFLMMRGMDHSGGGDRSPDENPRESHPHR